MDSRDKYPAKNPVGFEVASSSRHTCELSPSFNQSLCILHPTTQPPLLNIANIFKPLDSIERKFSQLNTYAWTSVSSFGQ